MQTKLLLLLSLCACQDPIIIPTSRIDNPKAIVGAFNDAGTDGDLYLISAERGEVAIIDLGVGALVDIDRIVPGPTSLQVGLGITDLTATPNGAFIYVVNGRKGELVKICTRFATTGCTARAVASRIAAPTGIERVTMSGARAYVTRPSAGSVIVYDLATDAVVGTLLLGGTPRHVAVTDAGTIAYVSDSTANSIARVRLDLALGDAGADAGPDGGSVLRIDVGGRTNSIALTADEAFVYALSVDKPEILVIDTTAGALVNVNAGDPTTTDKGIRLFSTSIGEIVAPLDVAMKGLTTADPNSGSTTLAYVTARDGFVYVVAPGGSAPHRVVDSDTTNGPSVAAITYSVGGQVASATTADPRPAGLDAGVSGITLSASSLALKPEIFTLTFEGIVVGGTGASAAQGVLLDGGTLLDTTQHFGRMQVDAGDHVVFTGALSPGTGAVCDGVDVDANQTPLEWTVSSVGIDRLAFAPAPPAACYTQLTSYQVRAARQFTVVGSVSGRQPRLIEGVPYQNSFFGLTMNQGTSASQRDAKWSFAVSTGIVNTVFKIGFLARSMFYAAANGRLYVVDEASRSVVELDSATGATLRVFK